MLQSQALHAAVQESGRLQPHIRHRREILHLKVSASSRRVTGTSLKRSIITQSHVQSTRLSTEIQTLSPRLNDDGPSSGRTVLPNGGPKPSFVRAYAGTPAVRYGGHRPLDHPSMRYDICSVVSFHLQQVCFRSRYPTPQLPIVIQSHRVFGVPLLSPYGRLKLH